MWPGCILGLQKSSVCGWRFVQDQKKALTQQPSLPRRIVNNGIRCPNVAIYGIATVGEPCESCYSGLAFRTQSGNGNSI